MPRALTDLRKIEIETSRLNLRQFNPQDLDDLYLIRSDSQVMRFITGSPSTKQEAEAALTKHLDRWQQVSFGHWALNFHGKTDLLGWCGLDFLDTTFEIEVGYGLAREYWGQGIATEAAAAALRYGFEELKLDRLVAVAYPENVGSWNVMKKLGMHYVKNDFYYGADMVYWEILQEQFRPGASKYVLRDNR